MNFSNKNGATCFGVRVIPRSSKSEIIGERDGALKVKLHSTPIKGSANEELIRLLAKVFGVSKSDIEIISGKNSKTKQLKILNADGKNLLTVELKPNS